MLRKKDICVHISEWIVFIFFKFSEAIQVGRLALQLTSAKKASCFCVALCLEIFSIQFYFPEWSNIHLMFSSSSGARQGISTFSSSLVKEELSSFKGKERKHTILLCFAWLHSASLDPVLSDLGAELLFLSLGG